MSKRVSNHKGKTRKTAARSINKPSKYNAAERKRRAARRKCR